MVNHAKIVSRLERDFTRSISTNSRNDTSFDDLSQGTEPWPISLLGSVNNTSFLMVTLAYFFVFLVERMYPNPSIFHLNPSVFHSNPPIKVAKIVSRLGKGYYKFFTTNSDKHVRFNDLSQDTQPRPRSLVESVSNTSFLMVTQANSYVSLLEKMFLNPSVFRSSPSLICLNLSVFRLNPSTFCLNSKEVYYEFFSTNSGVYTHFDNLSPGTEPQPRLSTAIERGSGRG